MPIATPQEIQDVKDENDLIADGMRGADAAVAIAALTRTLADWYHRGQTSGPWYPELVAKAAEAAVPPEGS